MNSAQKLMTEVSVLAMPLVFVHELQDEVGVGVERHGAAEGDADADQQRLPVLGEQQPHGAGLGFAGSDRCLGRADLLFRNGFLHGAPQPQDHQGSHAADGERDTPAPLAEVALGHDVLQDDQHQQGQHLAADQGDVLEAGEEAAALGGGSLGHVRGAGAVLAAHREALDQADENQHHQGPDAHLFVVGRSAMAKEPADIMRHTEGQRSLAALPVGVAAEEPGADGAHQERRREDGHRFQAGLEIVLRS